MKKLLLVPMFMTIGTPAFAADNWLPVEIEITMTDNSIKENQRTNNKTNQKTQIKWLEYTDEYNYKKEETDRISFDNVMESLNYVTYNDGNSLVKKYISMTDGEEYKVEEGNKTNTIYIDFKNLMANKPKTAREEVNKYTTSTYLKGTDLPLATQIGDSMSEAVKHKMSYMIENISKTGKEEYIYCKQDSEEQLGCLHAKEKIFFAMEDGKLVTKVIPFFGSVNKIDYDYAEPFKGLKIKYEKQNILKKDKNILKKTTGEYFIIEDKPKYKVISFVYKNKDGEKIREDIVRYEKFNG